MRTVLITGGAGFFGEILKRALLDRGFAVVSLDLHRDPTRHERLATVQGDLRDEGLVEKVFAAHRPSAVLHCAAILAHDVNDQRFLWSCNVDGTAVLAETAARYGIRKLVFISSNCLWGHGLGRPVREDDEPAPAEIYGRSKWEGEKRLSAYRDRFDVVVLRCPTIIDEGRLGLLAILFEFIDDGRTVWVVGQGDNRYQFIDAGDLADACLRALEHDGSNVFHVGAADVKTLREVYQYVIERAGSRSRVGSLPKMPALAVLRAAHALGLSPLGPYHYRMLAESFAFDTSKIRAQLGWQPTRTNEEMLLAAYRYYREHRAEIAARADVSAHKRPAKMGIIRLVKWLS